MKTLSILCFLSSLLLLSSIRLASGDKCNPTDKKVLFKIKEALHNPYDLASWTHDTDCCDWYCVKCNPTNNNHIYSLNIDPGEINAQIPPSIGDLPYLETLILRKIPNLTGTIPPAIAKLTRLKFVRLSWTNLTGPVPGVFSQLKNLEYLDLSYNKLTGTIPPSLSILPKLGALFLDRNQLTGSIPESFRMQGADPYLFLSHNQLSGKIPTTLSNTDFVVIELFRNKLEGDASFLFGKNKSAQRINLNRNMLEFDLSKVTELPTDLNTLDLSHNKIFGSLPKQLTKLPMLQSFNVSYNRLCGKIPAGGALKRFDKYSFYHNKCLCGAPLDACTK